ncbi:MAG TPA: 50S ribosomal protein L32 [Patescibacteria group bacterium]|nr:50S ribosomal protein L32 [Patescibacteria group bacterium]
MPNEPKKRHSRARQGKRRASIKLTVQNSVPCENCGNQHMPHTVCKHCGFYKKEQIFAKNQTK